MSPKVTFSDKFDNFLDYEVTQEARLMLESFQGLIAVISIAGL